MNIDFRILWYEDNASWYRATSKEIDKYIINHNFKSNFDVHKTDDINFNFVKANKYDLILMDYKLISVTGDEIIEKIRQNEILTDIVFYSSEFEEMKSKINEGNHLLDGVYFTDRKDEFFNPKVFGVINKIIKKSEEIVNLRGIVMDNTCEFDEIMKEILILSYGKLDTESKNILNKKIKKMIGEANKYYCKDCDEILREDNIFVSALNSPGYIIDAYKKSRLIKSLLDILKDKFEFSICENFHEEYNKEIIKIRNDLGHVRKNNENDNFYFKDKEGNEIIISEELCTNTRGSILKYKKILDNILEFIIKQI